MSKDRQPRCALITGAASGIGRCVALECASHQWPLVLIDINEDGLCRVADEIRQNYPSPVHTFAVNLAERDAPEKCLAFCDQNALEIDFLANIAGIFTFAPLVDTDRARTELMLDLHVHSVTRMSVVFGERMRSRRFGYIMNISSMSAWMPMPGIATYNATKSYIRSMSRSLRFELLPFGVSVTAVCPGGINTTLFGLSERLRKLAVSLHVLMEPEKLARKAVNATLRRKNQTIPGLLNYLFTAIILFMPDWLVSFIMKRLSVYDRFLPPECQKHRAETENADEQNATPAEQNADEPNGQNCPPAEGAQTGATPDSCAGQDAPSKDTIA